MCWSAASLGARGGEGQTRTKSLPVFMEEGMGWFRICGFVVNVCHRGERMTGREDGRRNVDGRGTDTKPGVPALTMSPPPGCHVAVTGIKRRGFILLGHPPSVWWGGQEERIIWFIWWDARRSSWSPHPTSPTGIVTDCWYEAKRPSDGGDGRQESHTNTARTTLGWALTICTCHTALGRTKREKIEHTHQG